MAEIDEVKVRNGSKQLTTKPWSSLGRSVAGNLINTGFDFLGGAISNYWNKKAEERADARTRKWASEQYDVMTKARAKAGLNPYDIDGSDSPNLVGASSTNSTSDVNVGADFLAHENLVLQNELIESQVNLNEANANLADKNASKSAGEELRAWEMFSPQMQSIILDNVGKMQANRYATVMANVAEATEQNQILTSDYELSELRDALGTNREILNNLRKDGKIKGQVYNNLVYEGNLLQQNYTINALHYSLNAKKYEYLTGFNYETGERVRELGTLDLDFSKLSNEVSLSNSEAKLAEIGLKYEEAEQVLDLILEGVQIVDIVNDDVFNWVSNDQKNAFQEKLLQFKQRDSQNRQKNVSAFLFIRLLPFILKAAT